MKAAIYNPEAKDTAQLNIAEVTKPQLSKDNAIVKVNSVGVCGSDLLKLDRSLVKPGTILGHEMVGIIDEISDEMVNKYGFQKGDRIVSSHHVPCLKCNHCLNGQESLCKQFKTTNFNPGAFCEYLELSELHLKHTVQKIPEHLSDAEASFTEPVACCIKAIERASVIARSRSEAKATWQSTRQVLIIGLGSIGLIMGQVVKYYAPSIEVTGLDLLADRLKLAQKLGFDQAILSLENQKYDYIFLTAGANASVDVAIEHANDGATIVVFASVADELKAFSNNQIYYKELTVLGSYSPNLNNLQESLELIAKGNIEVKDLITHQANLDDLGSAIQKLKSEQGIKLLLTV